MCGPGGAKLVGAGRGRKGFVVICARGNIFRTGNVVTSATRPTGRADTALTAHHGHRHPLLRKITTFIPVISRLHTLVFVSFGLVIVEQTDVFVAPLECV